LFLMYFLFNSALISAESTDRKRIAMKRFKERLAQLTPEEAHIINRCHRRYVKTIPGKLDHASLVAVHLAKMNHYHTHSCSADGRSPEITFKAIRTESSRSLGSLGKYSPMVESETRRGSLN
jgi:hypothetical protein